MIYIIDNKVAFNTENGSLKSIKNGKEVFLSSLNVRVFKCLLEHGVKPVSREDIFKQVWGEQGLSVSSATLNQYISLTRRALLTVGFSDRLIITVAKTGYRINKTIFVKVLEISPPGQSSEDVPPLMSVSSGTQKSYAYHYYLMMLLRTLSIALPIAILFFLFFYYQHYRENESRPFISYLGVVKGCPIYYYGKYLDKKTERYLQFLNEKDIYGNRCGKDEVIITRLNHSLNTTEDSGRHFIAKCVMDSDHSYHHCESEYIRAWKKS
ncbi:MULTISPECIES: winged helix-turn-helix domain-containing protein [unclassified Serratia (in: enterobacteria)]|uniref:winged helix-turn-helix domain-containing protein n=1 Tax=unclassified Serratia (in: enterobacteria) TaxID=2647522 RepID=UPI002ED014D8|nr:winged helix-turn-helix domain-containing protein [Serratia sp. C2(2)]MEE4447875.1 winged helix-turn-helix domain-containing protein [Serratia sp. C2(1)]